MRGIKLISSIGLFGFKEGFKLWFHWSFIGPLQMWYWLNISHKPYCTYSGYHCKNKSCSHKHITSKKAIQDIWKSHKEELAEIEVGPNGKCIYCGEEKATIIIPNPNFDKLSSWKVCPVCKEIIETQHKLSAAAIMGDQKLMIKMSDKLVEIANRTGKSIIHNELIKVGDKYDSFIVTYGEDDGKL